MYLYAYDENLLHYFFNFILIRSYQHLFILSGAVPTLIVLAVCQHSLTNQ